MHHERELMDPSGFQKGEIGTLGIAKGNNRDCRDSKKEITGTVGIPSSPTGIIGTLSIPAAGVPKGTIRIVNFPKQHHQMIL